MSKKVLLALGSVAALIAGVAGLAAYEAHVINVIAHIENSLDVHGDPIDFGTVFPQEYREAPFTVLLSDSFALQDPVRVNDVYYKIVQKLKPCPVEEVEPEVPAHCTGIEPLACMYPTEEECVIFGGPLCYWAPYQPPVMGPVDPTCVPDTTGETPHNPTGWHYLSLCPFLSKLDADPEDMNDTGVPSYWQGTECITPSPDYATGQLILDIDELDEWKADLKVPPIEGFVGQDWPDGCPIIPANDMTYGCDLWVEVTGFSYPVKPGE